MRQAEEEWRQAEEERRQLQQQVEQQHRDRHEIYRTGGGKTPNEK